MRNIDLMWADEELDKGKSLASVQRALNQRAEGRIKHRQQLPARPLPVRQEPRIERVPDAEFFSSREWQTLRYRAIKLHGTKCLCCGAGREDGKKIHVDHIKSRFTHPELQWTLSNLQILCEDCNMGKGAWDDTDWRRAPNDRTSVH